MNRSSKTFGKSFSTTTYTGVGKSNVIGVPIGNNIINNTIINSVFHKLISVKLLLPTPIKEITNEEEKEGTENIYEEIMAENLTNLMENINMLIL